MKDITMKTQQVINEFAITVNEKGQIIDKSNYKGKSVTFCLPDDVEVYTFESEELMNKYIEDFKLEIYVPEVSELTETAE